MTYLFGKPEVLACHRVASNSYILMLRHPNIAGTLEISTNYSWGTAQESLKVCTSKGIYRLSQMDELTYESSPSTILGIPSEKVHPYNKTIEQLYNRNNFTPTLPNNQVHSQGYFTEIQTFADAVEGHETHILSSIETIKSTYQLIETIRTP